MKAFYSTLLILFVFISSANAGNFSPATRSDKQARMDTTPVIILPVTIASFTAHWINNNTMVELDWSYADEAENRVIVIERSNDAVHFKSVGALNVVTEPSHIRSYSYVDSFPVDGRNQYRLNFIYPDDQSQYSYIISVESKEQPFAFKSAYPNPFLDQLNVSWHAQMSGKAAIVLLDMSGKERLNFVQTTSKGLNTVQISQLGQLPPGYYILQIKTPEGNLQQKLVKSH